jgi:AraC-like DNA-binding protein
MPFHAETMRNPHKFDFFIFVNHISGSIKFKIDMVEHELSNPFNVIKLAPGQIVSFEHQNEFDAVILFLSKRFVENLLVYVNGTVPFRFGKQIGAVEHYEVNDNDHSPNIFFMAVQNCLRDKTNPYRLQVVQHLMMAMFYASEKVREIDNDNQPSRTNADVLSKKFLELVNLNFRKERQLQFYADALCITPRYLSRVVKECTGSSAAEWIERCVVLEARALLKSTNMTIQQISDELNFPSQTFFGKYFKRRVGMSPKEYRRVG